MPILPAASPRRLQALAGCKPAQLPVLKRLLQLAGRRLEVTQVRGESLGCIALGGLRRGLDERLISQGALAGCEVALACALVVAVAGGFVRKPSGTFRSC